MKFRDVDENEGLRILMECEHRNRYEPQGWGFTDPEKLEAIPEVLHEGIWKTLGRCDKRGEVHSRCQHQTFDGYVRSLKGSWGLRITHDHLFVIDSMTDG